jgi:hypothetical protein
MAIFARKPRAGVAGLPDLFANADGGCDARSIKQIASTFNGAVRPRHAHIFARDAYGHYVEPLWCSARLFEAESFGAPGARVYDPGCGWGTILKAAQGAGYTPIGSDIVDRRAEPQAFATFPFAVCDFLIDTPVRSPWSVACNPPFTHIEEFCERALDIAIYKVAMLVPWRRLPAAHWLQRLPLESVYQLNPRPSLPPASYIAEGKKPRDGSQDFAWLIFNKRAAIGREPRLRWLHRDGATA